MPHNMLATIITELRLSDAKNDISMQSDTALELKALSILDKEVRDVADELSDAQAQLSQMTSDYQQAQTKLTDIVSQIQTHEGYALQAIKQKNEALALAVAEKIASLEASHKDIADSTEEYAKACDQLSNALHQNEVNLFMLKQQIDTVKASESVHKAQIAMSVRYAKENAQKDGQSNATNNTANIRLRTARHAFAHMQTKQRRQVSVKPLHANENTNVHKDADLHQKLVQAGIASHAKKAEDVLARIKNKPT